MVLDKFLHVEADNTWVASGHGGFCYQAKQCNSFLEGPSIVHLFFAYLSLLPISVTLC